MDQLWSPWRFRYVSDAAKSEGCVFCDYAASDPSTDRQRLILHRGRLNFIVMNLYPYTTGHVMIAPYAHIAKLTLLDSSTLQEMVELARSLEAAFEFSYHPEGYNVGMNLGKSAGAGIADHLHLHFLPRWNGDTNFMTVIAETRVHPEALLTTYDKLSACFRHCASELNTS